MSWVRCVRGQVGLSLSLQTMRTAKYEERGDKPVVNILEARPQWAGGSKRQVAARSRSPVGWDA